MGMFEGMENMPYLKRLMECYLDVFIITTLKLLSADNNSPAVPGTNSK